MPGYWAQIQTHACRVARPARFCPAASPVVKLNRRNRYRLAANCSMSCRCPVRVVDSASRLIDAKFSVTHSPNARASRAVPNPKAGARCMASPTTVVVTPPAACSSFIPRL